MPDYPINLGKPEPMFNSMPDMASRDPEIYYPSVHIDLPEGVDLPEEGTITFKFKLNRITEDVKNEKCCADLDLVSIVDTKASKSSKEEEYTGDTLDRLRKEVESEND